MVEKPIHKEFQQVVDKRYRLENLINMDDLRKLLEDFHKIAPFPVAVLNLKGDVLLESHWEPICTRFHRVNPKTAAICTESDIHFNAELAKGDDRHILYRCANGLYDAASPIIIEGQHLGNFFIGQFLLEPADEGFFREQAQRYGFEEEEYLEVLSRVPIISEHDLNNRLDYLCGFAEFLGNVGLKGFQRDRAEEALRESEKLLSMAGRTARFGGWSAHPDGQEVVWSEQVALIHEKQPGYSPTVKEAIQYYAPEWRDKIAAVFQICTREGTPWDEEMEIITAGGHRLWVRSTGEAVRDNMGKIVRVEGSFQDITERKRAEDGLRESEEKYRQLADSLPQIVFETDEKGNLTFTNRVAFDTLGYTREDLKKGLNALQMLIPDDHDRALKNIQRVLKGEKIGGTEYTAQTKDGRRYPAMVYSAPIISEGKSVGMRGMVVDLTEVKRAQKALLESEEKLARSKKMESLGLLAGGVAHDLNNILSGIVSYPELLLMDLPKDSPLTKPIKTIQESGMRAADVVEDLLSIARGVATGKEALNLNTLVTEYLGSAEYQKLEKTHSLVSCRTELDPDLLNMGGSPTHIKKILMNLVTNASEAIEGSGVVTISTTNRYLDEPLKGYEDIRTGEYILLSVSEEGTGISPEDLEKIFEPFYTKKIMGRSGTGLGLAVVWNTVQDHNGYINVNSSEKGTVFELYFPVTREELTAEKGEVPLDHYLGHGEKILVVDDEERQREIASEILTRLGYIAEAVSSGEEAIEYVKENPVDLIVLDMVMPKGINGRKTYEEIIKIHPGQKAIIASGYAKTKEVGLAQELGAGKYIKKPYTLEKIGVAVKKELEK